jgi:hypothetical protein
MTKAEYVAARKLSPPTKPVRGCHVCNHPERVRIEALRVAGVSIDKLGEQFDVHRDAVWRHCTHHMTDEAKASYLLGPAKIADLCNLAAGENRSLIDYLAVARSLVMNQMDREAQANRPYAVERLAGRLVEILREIGKITGEVTELAKTSISITYNSVAVMDSPIIAELQTELLTAMRPFPDARQAVIALFVRLDERHGQPETKFIEGAVLESAAE